MSRKILVSITGSKERDWKSKLKEIEHFKIREVALFLEIFRSIDQRKKIYGAIKKSCIKSIPLVHARNDMELWEFKFLEKNFGTKIFTIHESSFRYLERWRDYHKKMFLEFNYNNRIPKDVDVKKIGGFCVDLSHFKAGQERGVKDADYVLKRKDIKKYFVCNHINGYSKKKKRDIHLMKNVNEFDYIKELPRFLFGKVIAIETFNTIKEQLIFKEYLKKVIK